MYIVHHLQAPLAGLVLFGLYLLGLLAHGVSTYRDCPEEAAALQQVYPTPVGYSEGSRQPLDATMLYICAQIPSQAAQDVRCLYVKMPALS